MSDKKDKIFAALQGHKTLSKALVVGLEDTRTYSVNTQHYALNKAISGCWHKGWPGASVSEVFGDNSSGKSLLISKAMASIQNNDIFIEDSGKDQLKAEDGLVILDDTEKAYSESFCEMLGVIRKDIVQMDNSLTVENHFETMEETIKTIRKVLRKAPIGVFLDSKDQLSTDHEISTDMDKKDMSKAGVLHKAFRKYSDFIAKKNVMYMIASHVIDNVGVMFGPNKTVKGGSATAYQSSIRVDLRVKKRFMNNKIKTDEIGERSDTYGVKVIAEVVKNKIAKPFQYAILDVFFDHGIDPYSGLHDYFIRHKNLYTDTPAKGGKNPQSAILRFINERTDKTFSDGDLIPFIIDNDILDIKKYGQEYMEPIDLGKVHAEPSVDTFLADNVTEDDIIDRTPKV